MTKEEMQQEFDRKIDRLNALLLPLLPGYFLGSGATSIQQLDELKELFRKALT